MMGYPLPAHAEAKPERSAPGQPSLLRNPLSATVAESEEPGPLPDAAFLGPASSSSQRSRAPGTLLQVHALGQAKEQNACTSEALSAQLGDSSAHTAEGAAGEALSVQSGSRSAHAAGAATGSTSAGLPRSEVLALNGVGGGFGGSAGGQRAGTETEPPLSSSISFDKAAVDGDYEGHIGGLGQLSEHIVGTVGGPAALSGNTSRASSRPQTSAAGDAITVALPQQALRRDASADEAGSIRRHAVSGSSDGSATSREDGDYLAPPGAAQNSAAASGQYLGKSHELRSSSDSVGSAGSQQLGRIFSPSNSGHGSLPGSDPETPQSCGPPAGPTPSNRQALTLPFTLLRYVPSHRTKLGTCLPHASHMQNNLPLDIADDNAIQCMRPRL